MRLAFRSRRPIGWTTWTPGGITRSISSLSVDGLNVVKLVPEYNKMMNRIIRDHRTILENYLNQQQKESKNSEWDTENNSWMKNASMTEEESDLTGIRDSFYKLMNREYNEIRQKRAQQSKLECSIDLYDRLMCALYPNDVLKVKKDEYIKNVFEIYCQFPSPAPRYIQAPHLEELLSLFMSGSKESSQYLFTVLVDMAECGLPITSREQTIALFRIGRSFNGSLASWQPLQDRYQALEPASSAPSLFQSTSVSFFNALLGIAYSSNNPTMILQVIRNLRNSNQMPDRMTLATCMLYESAISQDQEVVKSIINDFWKGPFVLDMSMLNLTMRSLLKCGLQETAERIFHSLLQHKIASPLVSSGSPFVHLLQRKVELMDFILSVVYSKKKELSKRIPQYSLPLIPDIFTYGNFVGHYCRTGQENAGLKLIQTMVSQGILPDRHVFYRFYQTYAKRKDWTKEGLLRLTNFLCSLNDFDGKQKTYTLSMAMTVISAYQTVFEERKKEIDLLKNEFDDKKGPTTMRVLWLLRALAAF